MVLDGDSSLEPLTATSPIPWSIVTLVASLTSHFKVDEEPLLISDGVAVKSKIDGGSCRQDIPENAVNTVRLKSKKTLSVYLYFIV